jgi:hypothetical protein
MPVVVGSFTQLDDDDKKDSRSVLNQLVDIVQEDVSGSLTRREYQVFVTGGVGPGITSSLFQTVYDQDFTLQTANPIFDMTVGLYYEDGVSNTASDASTGVDSTGKLLFPSQSVMMREKIDVYKQYAKTLLGDSTAAFFSPFDSTDAVNRVDEAMFISFKRLFARDALKKETFAMRFFQTGTMSQFEDSTQPPRTTLDVTSQSGSIILTDIGAATNTRRLFGGDVSNIVEATNIANKVGLLFYEQGTAVLDMSKIMSGAQHVSGVISAMNAASPDGVLATGTMVMGSAKSGNQYSKYIPDLMVSASIDDIVDHLGSARFSSGTLTAATFQNATTINSSLYFCRAPADAYNFSSNPTFTDSDGRLVVVEQGQNATQRSFTFVTTVGLHDSQGNLLAVAKLSRPVEKNDERDVTFRVRLDF